MPVRRAAAFPFSGGYGAAKESRAAQLFFRACLATTIPQICTASLVVRKLSARHATPKHALTDLSRGFTKPSSGIGGPPRGHGRGQEGGALAPQADADRLAAARVHERHRCARGAAAERAAARGRRVVGQQPRVALQRGCQQLACTRATTRGVQEYSTCRARRCLRRLVGQQRVQGLQAVSCTTGR